MVVTRSQGDAMESQNRNNTVRVFEESPLSPEDTQRAEGTPRPEGAPSVPVTRTEVRTGHVSPPRSHRSTTSATMRSRLAELQAEEKLAAIRREELRMEAELIKKRLAVELTSIRDEAEDTREQTNEEPDERIHRVDDWLRSQPEATRGEQLPCNRVDARQQNERRPERRARSQSPSQSSSEIKQLAAILEKMTHTHPPPRQAADLPVFTGAINEWLPFKAAMRDSTQLYRFSPVENIARLRNSLRGDARDAVAALLHTANNPDEIMRTLEQCFGRPEVIIDKALDDMRKLPRPGATASELNAFAVKLQNIVCVLLNLDKRSYLYNPMLAREVLEKLSPHLKSRWCDYAEENEGTTDPEVVVLSRFLMREASRALKHTYAPATASTATSRREILKPAAPQVVARKRQNVFATVDTETEHLCPSCDKPHLLSRCPQYKALNVEQRWELVKSKGVCFKCIDKRHRRVYCKGKPCGINSCRRPHHSSLHNDRPSDSEDQATNNNTPSTSETVMAVATTIEPRQIILKICPVTISGPKGAVNTYALLDEGSTISLIDEDLAKDIGAHGPSHPLQLQGVNMGKEYTNSQVVQAKLYEPGSNKKLEFRARTIKGLRLREQTVSLSTLQHAHLRNLKVKQVCYEKARPRILIGTDHWEMIVSRELRVGKPNQPAASKTQLGWVVHGTAPHVIIGHSEALLHIYAPERNTGGEIRNENLHELVERHFKIDALGVAREPRVSDADKRAIRILDGTIQQRSKGYEVGLPWRRDDVALPNSYNMALRRLYSIEKKMDRSTEFAAAYTSQIGNLFKKGYAVRCEGHEQTSNISWFLPHFAVFNPNKPGKLRVVFDAAARSGTTSLNDELLEGPDLLRSLQGILFRFREKPVAVTADIEEMFLRIRIREADQPAQQFLWRGNDRNKPPQKYKMRSLIFGAASSPFIAHSVRDRNAEKHARTHPNAFKAITQSHYMDDLVDSYDDEETAIHTIKEIEEVHAVAGFTLRGWSSNRASVLSGIRDELRARSPAQLGGHEQEKILGLYWNAATDELGFNTSMHRVPADVRARKRAPTKREALSAVMSIYDPLGLLSHYTIRAKIFLQNLWRLQIGWDDEIPEEDASSFDDWLQQLENVANLRLPRYYSLAPTGITELHILCDASEQAYATTAYWRTVHGDGYIDVTLVAAKSKVAPRRVQTIPRLELQAAVIGARLSDTIRREHRIDIARTVYWTDSTTVVHWIRNDKRRYTPYVSHRLSEIAELTEAEQWRWLPTYCNVADDATRASNAGIAADERWFTGPSFLRCTENEWPAELLGPQENFEEATVNHTVEQTQPNVLPDATRFSSYERLVRTVATVFAFADICRRQASRVEKRHLERAEIAILRRTQQESFGEEINKLTRGKTIPRSSRLYKLDPELDDDGTLRMRGRIGAANVPTSVKRPVILDGKHTIVRKLIAKQHRAAAHGNRERVINDLRQRYWILKLRPAVRSVERECAMCRVRKAVPRAPVTGDLPAARLDPFHRPFTNCGVDYCGPMYVTIGRRREKRWIALFTCLTTRAIHLEIVGSLSTDSAIMALRRMAARRGWPALMYSDNAANFRGADTELRAAYAEWAPALRGEGLRNSVEWRYIPPGAPNQGGAWERLVRSVKTALAATLNERAPKEEVLQTVLAEAEHSINARPLTHVSVDPRDPEAITPNHFLLGSSTGMPTTGTCDTADRRTWRATQALADHFWRRWVKEYLPTLVPRGNSADSTRPLNVGDLVVVVDSALPRNTWPRGVVTKTYTGPDGGVRSADVKTRSGVFRRPTTKLAVLRGE